MKLFNLFKISEPRFANTTEEILHYLNQESRFSKECVKCKHSTVDPWQTNWGRCMLHKVEIHSENTCDEFKWNRDYLIKADVRLTKHKKGIR